MRIACLKLFCVTCLITLQASLVAQKLKWQDPLEQKVLVVQGKLPTMTTNSFQRLPDDIEQEVRPPV